MPAVSSKESIPSHLPSKDLQVVESDGEEQERGAWGMKCWSRMLFV